MRKLAALLALTFMAVPAWALTGTFSGDGQSTEIRCRSGELSVTVEDGGGNGFDGGTVVLQYERSDNDFRAVTDGSWTADNTSRIEFGSDMNFRLDLSGSAAPTVDYLMKCKQ